MTAQTARILAGIEQAGEIAAVAVFLAVVAPPLLVARAVDAATAGLTRGNRAIARARTAPAPSSPARAGLDPRDEIEAPE